MEDIDSDNDVTELSALNYNYDVLNLKEEATNPYFNVVKEVIEYHDKRSDDLDLSEGFDAARAIQSG